LADRTGEFGQEFGRRKSTPLLSVVTGGIAASEP
jgi:hypothetical protein